MSTAILRIFTALFGRQGFRHQRSKRHETSITSNPCNLDTNCACRMYQLDHARHIKNLVLVRALSHSRQKWREVKRRRVMRESLSWLIAGTASIAILSVSVLFWWPLIMYVIDYWIGK